MRKLFIFIVLLFFPFLFITCKQYNVNIEDYLSYWSGEAYVIDHTIEAVVPQVDGEGIKTVPSAKNVAVTLKLSNPKKIPLIMPTSTADAGNIIHFKGLSQQPVIGTDYTLTQTADNTLQLVYTDAFLQAHEWGNGGIGADITLYAKDGRKFTKSYAYTLKVNTPPPQPRVTIAKTAGEPAYYVLCITVPEMDKKISGGLLHKDITRIEINGAPYLFSVNEAQDAFVKPESDAFITSANVEKLSDPDEFPSGGWVLYYKTDAEVKDGAAKKDYTVTLKDQAGLTSETLTASTKLNKVKAVTLTVMHGAAAGGNGSESDPYVITAGADGLAKVEAKSDTAGAIVHCTLTEQPGGSPAQQTGNPVTVTMPLSGETEKRYKLTYAADGAGFTATAEETVYYRITFTPPAATTYTVTFDAQGGTPVPDPQTVANGTKAADPSASVSKPGFYLDGWYTETAYTHKWDFNTNTVTGNITLYAKWGTGTAYKVEHYQQNIDGSYPTSPTYTDNLHGTPGQNAAVKLKDYTGFEAGTYTSTTIAAGGNTVVKVSYQRKTCAVSYNVNGSDGSIAVTDVTGGSVSASPVTVKYGGSVTFKASPAVGYEVDSWSSNVTETPSTDRKEARLSNITAPATVTVQFKKKAYKVAFKVTSGQGKLEGLYSGQNKTAQNDTGTMAFESVPHGALVSFTATPTNATSYKVGDWTCTPSAGFTGGSGQSNTSLTVTADTTVSVQFVQLDALSLSTLTIHGENAANGSVTLPYTVTQVAQSDINLTFSGHSGITFTVAQTLPLTLQPGVPQDITINVAASSGHYPAWTKTVSITRAKNNVANLKSFTLNEEIKNAPFANEYEVTSDTATVAGFTFAPGGDGASASVSPAGAAVNIPAGTGKSFTITVKAQNGDEKQTVTFTVKRKNYTVHYSVAGGKGGTIQAGSETAAASGSIQVEHGGGVTFTAVPGDGWAVDSWSTNVMVTPSTDNKKAALTNVTQATDKNVTVTFKPTGLPPLVIDQNLSGSADKKTISGTEKPHTGQATDDIVASGLYRESSAPLVIYNKSGTAQLKLSAPTGATAHYALNSGTSVTGSGISVDSTQTHTLEVWIERNGISGTHTTLYVQLLPYLNTYAAFKNVVKNIPTGAAAVEVAIDSFNYAASDSEILVSGNKKLILMSKDTSKKDIGKSGTGRLFKITGNSTVVLKDVNLKSGIADDGKGGTVYVEAGSTLGLSGDGSVSPGGGAPGSSDVYLETGAFIRADSALTASSPVARITPAAYTEGVPVLKEGSSGLLSTEHTKFAVTTQKLGGGKTQEWEIDANGKLAKKQFIIDASDSSTWGGEPRAWAALKAAVEKADGAEKITVRGSVKARYDVINLEDNDKEIAVKRAVEIVGDGTGAVLDADNGIRIFNVDAAGKLTLRNLTLKKGFTNENNTKGYGGAIHNAGELTIISCDITESKAKFSAGGGIYVAEGAKCTITGSSTRKSFIRKNEAPQGAGIQVEGKCTIGEYTVIGGSSAADVNTSTENGGGVFIKGSKAVFTMKDDSRVIPSGGSDTDKPGKNDVYLGDGATIRIEGTWSGTDTVARITPKKYFKEIQVLTEGTTGLLSSEYTKFTVTPKTVPAQKKWIIDDQGKLRELIGGANSSSPEKWKSLRTAVSGAEEGEVLFIEGEYSMSTSTKTLKPVRSCSIRGTNNAVLDGRNDGTIVSLDDPSSVNVTLENLTIKNGKDEDYALSAYWGSSFYLKNVTVNSTKKILQSNSGAVTFENVKALGSNSIIELGGGNSGGSGEVEYSYLKVKGDTTEIQGTVKLIFPYSHSEYSGAIMICDKKAYSLRLDFGSDYNNAKDKQVVFLDSAVSGFTLAEAVAHITVVNGSGGSQWHIDSNGFLRKK